MLKKQVDKLIRSMERMRFEDYVRYAENRKERMKDAFLQGIFRGLGAMIGFSILGAIVVLLLQFLAQKNLPVIGEFIAQIVKMVQIRIE